MDRIFKKFLYTGVGLVSTTAEHFQKQLNEVKGQLTSSELEGERIVNDLVDDLKGQREKLDTQMKGWVDQVLDRFEFTSYEEVESLKKRVEKLSQQTSELTEK